MDIEFSFNSPVGDALSGIAQALGQAGIEHADNEARLLLSSTFGVSSSDITLAVIMGISLKDLQSAGHCPISPGREFPALKAACYAQAGPGASAIYSGICPVQVPEDIRGTGGFYTPP